MTGMTDPAVGVGKRGRSLSDNVALVATLGVAVPMRIEEMSTWDDAARQSMTTWSVDIVCAHGDDLLYGGEHCAKAFNALAQGLAILAYRPGGVTFAGLHWCVGSGHSGVTFTGPYCCDAEMERERAIERERATP